MGILQRKPIFPSHDSLLQHANAQAVYDRSEGICHEASLPEVHFVGGYRV